MNRGIARGDVVQDDRDGARFVWILGEIAERHDVRTLAYCLMTNHFHLLLSAPDTASMSAAMQRLGGIYTQRFNHAQHRDGALFRGRFRSIPVESEPYLLAASRYIHLNPLGIGSGTAPRTYPWSSYPAYLGTRPTPTWLETSELLAYFNGDTRRFAEFTDSGSSHDRGSFCRPSGSPAPDINELRAAISAIAAIDAIDDVADDEHAVLRSVERTLLTLVADNAADQSVRDEVTAYLGWSSADAARMGRTRALARWQRQPAVRRLLTAVTEYLGHAA